jgi:hypothetical protein
MGGCCSTEGVPGGGAYQPKRSEAYVARSPPPSLDENELHHYERAERASTQPGNVTSEPWACTIATARDWRLSHAEWAGGANADPEQYAAEVAASAPAPLRFDERRRIADWIDRVHELNRAVPATPLGETTAAALESPRPPRPPPSASPASLAAAATEAASVASASGTPRIAVASRDAGVLFQPIPAQLRKRETSPRHAAIESWLTPT